MKRFIVCLLATQLGFFSLSAENLEYSSYTTSEFNSGSATEAFDTLCAANDLHFHDEFLDSMDNRDGIVAHLDALVRRWLREQEEKKKDKDKRSLARGFNPVGQLNYIKGINHNLNGMGVTSDSYDTMTEFLIGCLAEPDFNGFFQKDRFVYGFCTEKPEDEVFHQGYEFAAQSDHLARSLRSSVYSTGVPGDMIAGVDNLLVNCGGVPNNGGNGGNDIPIDNPDPNASPNPDSNNPGNTILDVDPSNENDKLEVVTNLGDQIAVNGEKLDVVSVVNYSVTRFNSNSLVVAQADRPGSAFGKNPVISIKDDNRLTGIIVPVSNQSVRCNEQNISDCGLTNFNLSISKDTTYAEVAKKLSKRARKNKRQIEKLKVKFVEELSGALFHSPKKAKKIRKKITKKKQLNRLIKKTKRHSKILF